MTILIKFAAALTLTVSACAAAAQEIVVEDAYARSSNPRSGAAFMVLKNIGDTDDRLVAARTDAAKRVELHTHVETDDGVVQMTRIEDGIPLAAGETHVLRRGGDHVMLMGLAAPLVDGDTITVTLEFENSVDLTFEVAVDSTRAPDAAVHDGTSD